MSRKTEYQPPWFHYGLYKAYVQSGLSIPEIARKAEISKSHAYRIFAAEQWPSIPVMMRLEDALGLERGALIRKEKSSN